MPHLIYRPTEANIEGNGGLIMSMNEGRIHAGNLESHICYMIEAHESLGEFLETEDGVMVNLFWSNEDGWVPFYVADTFTKDDYYNLRLPEGGNWVQVQKSVTLGMSNSVYVIQEISGITRQFSVFPDDDEVSNVYRIL